MAELTVGAGLARGLVKLAVSTGADEAALAERSGINLEDLQDQDNRVPMAKYIALMRAAKELTGDPALALHWGEAVDLSEVSIVGLIMNAAETMGEAFVQMNRFGKLAIDFEVEGAGPGDRFRMRMEKGGVWLEDARANPNEFPELTEVGFARMTCQPRRFLPKQHVLEVHVTHPAPAYRAEYDRVFQCPVVFDSHWNALRVDPAAGSHRVALQPRYVFGVLSERAQELLNSLETSKSARGKVESLLMPILHTGDVGIDVIAKKVGQSRQTLFRRLKAEGVTFEQVLDELRQRLAMHYLGNKKVSVNETAYLVGFSDPTAFSRAFKRWTGKSPREVRASKPD
ncbi:MAG: AraC family transcriptional regulator [Hyphomonadaceae bacterium]|nr:AraC family transcriptional regulator [Hyphomonadaceae bacterium]